MLGARRYVIFEKIEQKHESEVVFFWEVVDDCFDAGDALVLHEPFVVRERDERDFKVVKKSLYKTGNHEGIFYLIEIVIVSGAKL